MNQIIETVKQNKKMVIILAAVLVLLLAMLVLRNGGGGQNGYFDTLESLNAESQYNGTITVNIGGKDIKIDILKNENNYAVSASVPNSDIVYNDLMVKQDGVIYLNSGIVSANGGLTAIRESQAEKKALPIPVVISALKNAEITTDNDEDGYATITVNGTEEWNAFFSALSNALSENADAISSCYAESDAVKTFITEAAKGAKLAAETNTVANTLYAAIKSETVDDIRKYSGSFELTADFSVLPDFVDPEDFDSNQFKMTGEINITIGAASTAKPVGAVYDANAKSISQFLRVLWSGVFAKDAYTALNEVTVTSSSVYNKYNLGEVIEESRFAFSKEGVESAEWIISSTDENIIAAYADKYTNNQKPIYDEASGVYKLVIVASEDALISLNKIGTTPKEFGEYLKTAKGGEIIV